MSQQTKQPTNFGALGTLVTVFFFWGFIAASNSIFIPFCKSHFALSQFESQLVGSAFYGAYFIGSLILFLVSNVLGYDILNKIGYKRGIIYGLLMPAVPETNSHWRREASARPRPLLASTAPAAPPPSISAPMTAPS